MSLPILDERLAAAAELAVRGRGVADIGCDHGKLTAVLAASGAYPKVIGADLRRAPLERARATLQRANCEGRAELRLGDGLSVLEAGEVGTIIIAGVSAQTIWQMLAAAPWLFKAGSPRLVLVPATRHAELRRWLWANGFALAADRPVRAAGRWYAVMAAEYTGEKREASLKECLYGLTAAEPLGEGYAEWQRSKLPKLRLGAAEGSALAAEMDEILNEVNKNADGKANL